MKKQNNFMWRADQGDQTYRNPILYADYSDPDVIRVGDTYFLTASSFNCVPGLPILCSQDLVNWSLCNYAVRELPYAVYDRPAHGKGIWAPSIRFHDNRYWIFFAMPDEGIFMTSTEDPFGIWEPITCVKAVKGWIDPCPLWDDDGRAYLVYAFANSRIGIKSKLGLAGMSPDGTRLLDEGRIIFDGTLRHPTIEGPKFYKRNGFYYIFAPAGGVRQGWQTVLRARAIYGPYEDKIVLHQGNTAVNGPHQGGLVEAPDGGEWFIHFQDRGVYGRITHLQPVVWKEDWPVIGIDTNGDGIGEPVTSYKKPYSKRPVAVTEPDDSDDFEAGILGLQWQWYANYKESFYSLTERKGFLRLYNLRQQEGKNQLIWNTANLLLQKLPCPALTVETSMECRGMAIGNKAGMLFIGAQYAYVAVRKEEKGLRLLYVHSRGEDEKEEQVLEQAELTGDKLCIRLVVHEGGLSDWYYRPQDGEWKRLRESFMTRDGYWMGAKTGLFAINEFAPEGGGHTDFDYFHLSGDEAGSRGGARPRPARCEKRDGMIVAKDGSGDFEKVQDAIDAVPKDNNETVRIYIKNGVYKEKLHIEKPYISLMGEEYGQTVLTYDDCAKKELRPNEQCGTFRSYSTFIGAHDFRAENITFQNTAGPGDVAGQALAVYADGDRLHFKNCRFLGCQDTVFTGPLPADPEISDAFKGPRGDAPKLNGRQYYEKCYIQGDVDFLFGSATAIFYQCEIFAITGTNRSTDISQPPPLLKRRPSDISSRPAG